MSDLTGIALLRTVVPDELADKLALIAHNWKRDKFALGDIRNSLWAMVNERLLPITPPDIDDFLAECVNHEVEPRTVRYYAMIAYAFPDPLRDEYSSLSHAHFAYAHTYPENKRLEVLKLARDREQSTGKVPSVAWLRAALSGYIYERESLGETPILDEKYQPGAIDEPELLDEQDEPAEHPIIGWLCGLRRSISFAIDHLDAAPLDSDTRGELKELLEKADALLGKAERRVVMV